MKCNNKKFKNKNREEVVFNGDKPNASRFFALSLCLHYLIVVTISLKRLIPSSISSIELA